MSRSPPIREAEPSPSMSARKLSLGSPRMPVGQISILAIFRLAEPIALFSIYPYIPAMISHLGAPDHAIGKYVGWTSAVFCLSQFVTAIPSGALSDRIGRKPVVLCCLIGVMVFSIAFGFSTSIAMVLATHAGRGFFNGNAGILRTVVAEIVPWKELQPLAFCLLPVLWTTGSILGPILGGTLAEPAKKYPELFSKDSTWAKYPFALPNVFIAVFFVNSLVFGVFFLRESLPSKRNRFDYGIAFGDKIKRCIGVHKQPDQDQKRDDDMINETEPLVAAQSTSASDDNGAQSISREGVDTPAESKGVWSQILTRQTLIVLAAYTTCAMQSMSFESLLPVFLHTKRASLQDRSSQGLPFKFFGGFGMDSQTMGAIYMINGIFGITCQFLCYPRMARYFGLHTCLRYSAALLPCIYFLLPLTVLIPNDTLSHVAVRLLLFAEIFANVFYFPSCTILLTNSAPSVEVLGTLNGVSTSMTGISKAVGPATIGALFSYGAQTGYLILPWWSLMAIGIAGCWASWQVRVGDGDT